MTRRRHIVAFLLAPVFASNWALLFRCVLLYGFLMSESRSLMFLWIQQKYNWALYFGGLLLSDSETLMYSEITDGQAS